MRWRYEFFQLPFLILNKYFVIQTNILQMNHFSILGRLILNHNSAFTRLIRFNQIYSSSIIQSKVRCTLSGKRSPELFSSTYPEGTIKR